MTATTLLDGHNTAIGTPTRLRTILKLCKRGTPGITYKRARTRPAAGSRISSATTIDLAIWTYNTRLGEVNTVWTSYKITKIFTKYSHNHNLNYQSRASQMATPTTERGSARIQHEE